MLYWMLFLSLLCLYIIKTKIRKAYNIEDVMQDVKEVTTKKKKYVIDSIFLSLYNLYNFMKIQ